MIRNRALGAAPPPEFPAHDIPAAPVPKHLAAGFRPLGSWLFFDPAPSACGWHIACPCCLAGRVLLRPCPIDCLDYELCPETCSAGCDPYSVVRWYAVRMGEPQLWWDWLDRQRARNRGGRR